jgi:hypothetical protein
MEGSGSGDPTDPDHYNEKNLNAQSVGNDPRMYSCLQIPTVEQSKGKVYGGKSKKECDTMRKNQKGRNIEI